MDIMQTQLKKSHDQDLTKLVSMEAIKYLTKRFSDDATKILGLTVRDTDEVCFKFPLLEYVAKLKTKYL